MREEGRSIHTDFIQNRHNVAFLFRPTKFHSYIHGCHPKPDAKTVTNFGDQSQIQRLKKKENILILIT